MQKWEYKWVVVRQKGSPDLDAHVVSINGYPMEDPQGSGIPVWEYLRQAGRDGWEAIGFAPNGGCVHDWRIIFKRPLP